MCSSPWALAFLLGSSGLLAALRWQWVVGQDDVTRSGVRAPRVCLSYGDLSLVDTSVTPLAFSRSRQRTVSSRDHEKFLGLGMTME